MSKSLGNLITIEEFLSLHSSDTLRIMVLNSGYRNPLTFNEEVIGQADKGLERLRSALRPALPGAKGAPQSSLQVLQKQVEDTRAAFKENMDDDFNTAGTLGILFDFVRFINQSRADGANDLELKPAQDTLHELLKVLGLKMEEKTRDASAADEFINLLLELRTELRVEKNFALGDKIRNRLSELGVVIEDSKDGTSWRWQ
jgi:cysteinyl-tRNA synthetase